MAWVARAIHESVAPEMQHEMEANDAEHMFSTEAAICGRCGQHYMIVYRSHFDETNPSYRNVLEHKITDSCRDGVHSFDDIPLEVS
jgi:hypothetical protein